MAAPGAKGSAGPAGLKRPRAIEIGLMRESMRRELRGLVGPTAIFPSQLFIPQRRPFIVLNIVCLALLFSCGIFTRRALTTAKGYVHIKKMHILSDTVHHTSRLVGHLCFIVCANEDLFGKVFFLFVAPCSASRMTYVTPYTSYMIGHCVLLIFRFKDSFIDELPFLISAIVCCHLLYEGFVTRRRSEEGALEKSRCMVTLAGDISCSVLNCFCDAVARVSVDLEILDDAPSLSTLISRRATAGRRFLDFVHAGDREKYADFIKSFSKSFVSDDDSTLPGADDVAGLQLRSVDIHLEDSVNVPVEVHVFHACLETPDEKPFFLIGIMERESYKSSQKKQPPSRPGGSARSGCSGRLDHARLNQKSGKLEPSRPAFEKKDVALMGDIELLRYSDSGASSSVRRRLGSGQRRDSSPRPQRTASRDSLESRMSARMPLQRSTLGDD